MILPRAYGFIFSRVLVFFPFYGLAKFKGCMITRVLVSKLLIPLPAFLVDMA